MSLLKGLWQMASKDMCKGFEANGEKTLYTGETSVMESRGNLRVSSTFRETQQTLCIFAFEVRMAAVWAGTFALLGALYSGAQYWLGKRILNREKAHLAAYYVLERIILDLLFLFVIWVVYPDGLLYGTVGLVATAITLSILRVLRK